MPVRRRSGSFFTRSIRADQAFLMMMQLRMRCASVDRQHCKAG